jgi:peptidoglycan biosynthesis protein MviN/MurJ (putative lipid II flippase)
VRSGLLTGAAFLVVGGSAAGAAAFLAQKFGRSAETDGLLAAYGVYLVLTVAAQSFRLVVLPDLTRAAASGRLAGELWAYVAVFLGLAVPVALVVGLLSHQLGEAIMGSKPPPEAASVAGRALVWLVPAAFAQLLAGLAASALAAVDSYGTAAAGYAAGGVSGLLLFVVLADGHGVVALAWGLTLNGAITLAVPVLSLAARGLLTRGVHGRARLRPGRRLWRLLEGSLPPIALQAFYLVGLRLAAALHVGSVTSLSYAYVLTATLVTVTAFALGLISSAPLTRRGLDAAGAAAHVVHSAWISLVLVGGAAGIFAVVGNRIASGVLGSAFSGKVGTELSRLVVELAPWMVVAVAFYAAYPLVFVLDLRRVLVVVSLAGLGLAVGAEYGLRAVWGLAGIAVALAIATGFVVAVLLLEVSPRALAAAALGLARLSLVVGVAVAAAFGLPSLVLGPVPTAAVGLAAYVALLAAARSLGLGEAWAYVRALH